MQIPDEYVTKEPKLLNLVQGGNHTIEKKEQQFDRGNTNEQSQLNRTNFPS